MVKAEAGGGFVKVGLGAAKLIGCPGVPKTKGLKLGRDVGEMLSIEVIEVSGILGAKFGNAPG